MGISHHTVRPADASCLESSALDLQEGMQHRIHYIKGTIQQSVNVSFCASKPAQSYWQLLPKEC